MLPSPPSAPTAAEPPPRFARADAPRGARRGPCRHALAVAVAPSVEPPEVTLRIVPACAPCLLLALSSFAAVGCGKSKVDQCNAFVERATKAQTVIGALKLDDDNAAKLEQEAVAIETEAKAVGAVSVSDAKLGGLRDEYGANLGKLAKITRDVAEVSKDAKVPAKAASVEARMKKLEQDADKIEKDESRIVDQVNAYCSAP